MYLQCLCTGNKKGLLVNALRVPRIKLVALSPIMTLGLSQLSLVFVSLTHECSAIFTMDGFKEQQIIFKLCLSNFWH